MIAARAVALVIATGFAASCASSVPETLVAERHVWRLPAPIANNAVAAIEVDGRMTAFSFAGLGPGKSWSDASAAAFACDVEAQTCRSVPGLPDGVGRLAAVAAAVDGAIYIFGGYTVAETGAERSAPEVWRFDPRAQTYARAADMPLPVDDAVAATVDDRFVYLVSGWHGDGAAPGDNVEAVQVFDAVENRWFAATAFPGAPVFGHAGGAVGRAIVVCDGVEVIPPAFEGEKRAFAAKAQCWRGDVDPADPSVIAWRFLAALAPAHYRMAATGDAESGRIVFVGGSVNPYNYDGVGYDGAPSAPSAHVWSYHVGADAIEPHADRAIATMDHRGLILHDGRLITLGGMVEGQVVTDKVVAEPASWLHSAADGAR